MDNPDKNKEPNIAVMPSNVEITKPVSSDSDRDNVISITRHASLVSITVEDARPLPLLASAAASVSLPVPPLLPVSLPIFKKEDDLVDDESGHGHNEHTDGASPPQQEGRWNTFEFKFYIVVVVVAWLYIFYTLILRTRGCYFF